MRPVALTLASAGVLGGVIAADQTLHEDVPLITNAGAVAANVAAQTATLDTAPLGAFWRGMSNTPATIDAQVAGEHRWHELLNESRHMNAESAEQPQNASAKRHAKRRVPVAQRTTRRPSHGALQRGLGRSHASMSSRSRFRRTLDSKFRDRDRYERRRRSSTRYRPMNQPRRLADEFRSQRSVFQRSRFYRTQGSRNQRLVRLGRPDVSVYDRPRRR